LIYDLTTGVTSINTLQTGNINFDNDAGMVSWSDLTLANAPAGTPQGYTAFLNGSSTISVYGVSAGSGNLLPDYPRVAIGSTTPPSSKLTIFANGTAGAGTFEVVNSASTTLFKILDNGATGVASTSPWRTFDVNGTVSFKGLTNDGSGNYICLSAKNEITYSTTACVGASTARVKNSITSLNNSALDIVNALRPVSFVYNQDASPNDQSVHLGFIAEEVDRINKNLVAYDTAGLPKSVKYDEFTPILAKAIQEQQNQIKELSSNIASSSKLDSNFTSNSFNADPLIESIKNSDQKIDSLAQVASSTLVEIDIIKANLATLTSSTTLMSIIASSTIDVLASTTVDIASTTVNNIINSQSFIERFINAVTDFLSKSIVNIRGIFIKELHIEEKLCVDDVCIDKEQLKVLLRNAGGSSTQIMDTSTIPESIPAPVQESIVTATTTTPVVDNTSTATTTDSSNLDNASTTPAEIPPVEPAPTQAPTEAPVVESTPVTKTTPIDNGITPTENI
jgi:hypothetical protein